MPTVTLYDLAVRYNSDKLFFHSYIEWMYPQIFAGMHVRRLLELGIGYRDLMEPLVPQYTHGSSLYLWRDYFPAAEIYACDIREDVLVNETRIHSMVCDQSKTADLDRLARAYAPWDVVIDDGSHVHEHQILTAAVLLPHVRQGGVYIVEDVMLDHSEALAKAIGGEVWKGDRRCDDNLVVCRKGAIRTSY